MNFQIQFIAALWLLVAAATGLVAIDKHQRVAKWAMLGLLFGPFALLAAAALPRAPLSK